MTERFSTDGSAPSDRDRWTMTSWAKAGGARTPLALVSMLGLGACALAPEPFTAEEIQARIAHDRALMFAGQEAPAEPITLYNAMARAIVYNQDNRVRVMEEAFAQRQLELSRWDMLPQVMADVASVNRNNDSLVIAEGASTASNSLERNRFRGDLGVAWNLLDFGMSYIAAEQQADRVLIAEEQRRRVIHQIIQDTRNAYWRAVAAERLLDRIEPLMDRVETARADAAAIERLRLQSPLDALTYQRTLLETLTELQNLRRDLLLAKTELAALMSLPLDAPFEIVVPDAIDVLPEPTLSIRDLEEIALAYRPELRAEDYENRIALQETHRAILGMLPRVEFTGSVNFDTNDFLVNNNWAQYGFQVTWNLIDLFSGQSALDLAEAEIELTQARRLALSVAVLSQVYVSYLNYENSRQSYETAEEFADIESRILGQFQAAGRLARVGDLAVIQAELNELVGDLRRDLAYADMHNAMGQLFLAVGADPLPPTVESTDLDVLAGAIEAVETDWLNGRIMVAGQSVSIPSVADAGGTDARSLVTAQADVPAGIAP